MFGMQWILWLSGIGLIWGIFTDNLWGLVIGGGVGGLSSIYLYLQEQ